MKYLTLVLLVACDQAEVRGAPPDIVCVVEDDLSYRCVANEVAYTCIRSPGWHTIFNCAPVKGCRQ